MKKIALFGLAADPPTLGHKYVVNSILDSNLVDEVWVNPVFVHFHNKKMESYSDRFRMCELLFNDLKDKVKVVRFEEEAYKYYQEYNGSTVDLLNYLRGSNNYGNTEFYIVIGQDNAEAISTWNNGYRLINQDKFIVIPREVPIEKSISKWYQKYPHCFLSEVPKFLASSTEVRNELSKEPKEFNKLNSLVSPEVLSYLINKNLYNKE